MRAFEDVIIFVSKLIKYQHTGNFQAPASHIRSGEVSTIQWQEVFALPEPLSSLPAFTH